VLFSLRSMQAMPVSEAKKVSPWHEMSHLD